MKKEKIFETIILITLFSFFTMTTFFVNYYKNIKPNSYNIVFKDIDSIVKGSPVRFMGINVGYVVKLRRKNDYIICKIRITKKNVKIPDFTRAKVAFNGLGGSKSVELFPPVTDEPEIKGIVADESLRINDFISVVRDLKDVCIVINNFIQEIDPIMLMNSFKEFTDPEVINRIDSDMERVIRKQAELDSDIKKTTDLEKSFVDLVDWLQKGFNSLFNVHNEQSEQPEDQTEEQSEEQIPEDSTEEQAEEITE